jgi:hypothetical protein
VKLPSFKLKQRRKFVIVFLVWAFVIALIMIRAHYSLYLRSPKFFAYKIAYCVYEVPSFEVTDMVLLFVAGLVVGIIVCEVKPLIYGFAASVSVAFIIAVAYAALFIWFILGYQEFFALIPFNLEWVIYLGMISMLWLWFPFVIGISAIGMLVGVFINAWLT